MKKYICLVLFLVVLICTSFGEDYEVNNYHVIYTDDVNDNFKGVYSKGMVVVYDDTLDWNFLWLSIIIVKSDGLVSSVPQGIYPTVDFWAPGEWIVSEGIHIKSENELLSLPFKGAEYQYTSDGKFSTVISGFIDENSLEKLLLLKEATARVYLSAYGITDRIIFIIPPEVFDFLRRWSDREAWEN